VTVYEYVCGGTIEERIEEILDGKRALCRSLVDGVSMDLSRSLSPTELFGLFGLPAPRRLAEPATPGDASARARSLLEGTGWSVRERPVGSDSVVRLKAERVDELGRTSALWVALARTGDDLDRLERIASALPIDAATRAALVIDGVASDRLRDAADRRPVEIWSFTQPPTPPCRRALPTGTAGQ
jgi:hypothetical protein